MAGGPKTPILGKDIRKRNIRRHTIAHALASGDYALMGKQRIKTLSRDVFEHPCARPATPGTSSILGTFKPGTVYFPDHADGGLSMSIVAFQNDP